MAARKQPHYALSLPLLFMALSTTLSFMFTSSNAAECSGSGSISVYWGQRSAEGSLEEVCDSGNYNIVILQTLIVYTDGRTPDLNLANHCGSFENPCSNLEPKIKHCQDIGVKVFLSIGFIVASSSPSDGQDVTSELANYLVETYLSGKSGGPLGAVSLDGIDIAAVRDNEHLRWDELVTLLKGSTTDRRIYISASPQCVYPDAFLHNAIQTGHVDFIWVGFYYNNPSCIYSAGNSGNLLRAWTTWTSNVPNSLIFLGLTANKDLAGYIEPEVVNSQILPAIKTASNYGGVMIWDRYYDITNDNYSGKIKDSVPKTCRCVCDEPAYTRFNHLKLARS